jgi:predicted dehydrogenase
VNRPRKGVLVGYGFIAEKGHVPVYLERRDGPGDFEIVAIADVSPWRREAARSAIPGARINESTSEMLRAEASSVDFVDITAPPYRHAEIAHAALDAGLHVLCEKPIAVSVDEATGMVEHAERAGRVLFPCHNHKHAPVIKAMRALTART